MDEMIPQLVVAVLVVGALAAYVVYRAGRRDRAYVHRGNLLTGEGEWAEAVEAYQEALQINPDSFEAHMGVAEACDRLEQWDQAVAAGEAAVALAADKFQQISAWERLGNICDRAGRFEGALAACEKILEIWPEHLSANLGIARFNSLLGRHDAARAHYEQLVQAHGLTLELCYGLGEAYRQLNRPDDSAEAYRSALAIQHERHDPGGHCGHTLMVLGDVYAQFARYDSAFEAYAEAHTCSEDWPAPYCGMGDALGELGRHDEAIAAYRAALKIDDQWEDAWRGLGQTYARLGRADDALEAFGKAIEINPDFAAAHLGIGQLHAAMGHADEAIDALEAAVRLDPDSPVAAEARQALDKSARPPLTADE